MGTKKWTAVEYDAAKYLKTSLGSKLKLVALPKSMGVQVVITLDDVLFKELSKNPSWLQTIQSNAAAKARAELGAVEKVILAAEAKAQKFNPKTATIFTRDLQTQLEKGMASVGDEMAVACDKLIKDYVKGRKDLMKLRIRCSSKILLGAAVVTAGATVSVAVAGGLSPIGIFGVAKGCAGIVQEILRLAADADKVAWYVQRELRVLKTLMSEENAKAKLAGKVFQGGKEVGLNLFGKFLGVETPSLRNCETHIANHRVNISKIEKQSRKLSEQIYAALDEQTKVNKALQGAKKTLPADKVGKIALQLDKVEQALDAMLNATIKANGSIAAAEDRQVQFEKALKGMQEGIPGWTKWVEVAGGLAIDLGMGIHDAATAIEKAVAVTGAVTQTVGNEVADYMTK